MAERVDEGIKADVMHWAAFYVSDQNSSYDGMANPLQDVRMRLGQKKIFHLEAWVVKVMSLQKVRCMTSNHDPR